MSELIDKLKAAGTQHKGTDLGGLLQWAALHVADQDEALAETRGAYAEEEAERLRLENALHQAKLAIEAALDAINTPLVSPIELGRDYVPHINLMAGHGDPDYLMKNGRSVRHIDLRSVRPRKAKTA